MIALLRTGAYGWQQEGLAQNAKAISELGKELYQRLAQLALSFHASSFQFGQVHVHVRANPYNDWGTTRTLAG